MAVLLNIPFQEDYGNYFRHQFKPGPEVIKLFSCSTQLRMKF